MEYQPIYQAYLDAGGAIEPGYNLTFINFVTLVVEQYKVCAGISQAHPITDIKEYILFVKMFAYLSLS